MSRAAARRMAARRGSGSNQTKMDELGRRTIAKNLLCDTGNHFFSYLRPPPPQPTVMTALSLSLAVSPRDGYRTLWLISNRCCIFFPACKSVTEKKKKNIQGWSLVALEPDRRYFYFFFQDALAYLGQRGSLPRNTRQPAHPGLSWQGKKFAHLWRMVSFRTTFRRLASICCLKCGLWEGSVLHFQPSESEVIVSV